MIQDDPEQVQAGSTSWRVVELLDELGCARTRRQDAPGRRYAQGLVSQELFFRVEDFSKFFWPSPRKHRLTVYRGLQVYCFVD